MTDLPPKAISDAPPESAPKSTDGMGGKDPFSDPDLALKIGLVGRLIGQGDEKKGNIAFVVAMIAFVLLCAIIIGWLLKPGDEDARQFLGLLITPIFGLLTGVIGFIQGTKQD